MMIWIVFGILFIIWLCFYVHEQSPNNQKVSVYYGYPKWSDTWLTVYHDRRTNEWTFIWDDLFAESRGEEFSDKSISYMYPDYDEGATQEEFIEAEHRLRERGLM